jgi:hypothetical protein
VILSLSSVAYSSQTFDSNTHRFKHTPQQLGHCCAIAHTHSQHGRNGGLSCLQHLLLLLVDLQRCNCKKSVLWQGSE